MNAHAGRYVAPTHSSGARVVLEMLSNPNVQIIVTTGVKLSGQPAEANKLGFGVFLAKPYSVEQLLGALESVLR